MFFDEPKTLVLKYKITSLLPVFGSELLLIYTEYSTIYTRNDMIDTYRYILYSYKKFTIMKNLSFQYPEGLTPKNLLFMTKEYEKHIPLVLEHLQKNKSREISLLTKRLTHNGQHKVISTRIIFKSIDDQGYLHFDKIIPIPGEDNALEPMILRFDNLLGALPLLDVKIKTVEENKKMNNYNKFLQKAKKELQEVFSEKQTVTLSFLEEQKIYYRTGKIEKLNRSNIVFVQESAISYSRENNQYINYDTVTEFLVLPYMTPNSVLIGVRVSELSLA